MINKKLICLIILLSSALATTTLISSSTPTYSVKHGDVLTFSFEYISNSSNASAFTFNNVNYTDYSCSETSCILEEQIATPSTLINDNHTWAFNVDGEQILSNSTYVMDLNLNISSSFTTLRNFRIYGNFTWGDGTPLTSKNIIINFLEGILLQTDSNGEFESNQSFEENQESGRYNGTVTATYSDFIKQTSFSTDYFGKPTPTLTLPRQTITASDVTFLDADVVEFEVIWETGKNPTNKTTLYFTLFNIDYSHSCSEIVSSCTKKFQVTVPERNSGETSFEVFGKSENADGTETIISETATLLIKNNDYFGVNTEPLFLDVYAGQSHQFEVNLTREGNINSNISIAIIGNKSEWVNVQTNKFTISDHSFSSFGLNIPYDAERGTYSIKIIFIGKEREYTLPLTLSLKAPNLNWDPLEESREVATQQELNYTTKLINDGQAQANTILLEPICPVDWMCSVSPSSKDILEVGEEVTVTLKAFIKHAESFIDKRIGIKATDGVGRTKSTYLNLNIVSKIVELSQDRVFTTTISGEEFSGKYFFVSGEEHIRKSELNTSGVKARIQRKSSLSTWSVKVLPDSIGVGSVCSVYVVTTNGTEEFSYELDSRGIERTLVGGVGDFAFEAVKFNNIGTCEVHLQYNQEDTYSYFVLTQPPVEKESELEQIKQEITRMDKEDNDAIAGFFVILIAVGFLAFRQVGAQERYMYQINPKQGPPRVIHLPTSWENGRLQPKELKVKGPTDELFEKMKKKFFPWLKKFLAGDKDAIEGADSYLVEKAAEAITPYTPKEKQKKYVSKDEQKKAIINKFKKSFKKGELNG